MHEKLVWALAADFPNLFADIYNELAAPPGAPQTTFAPAELSPYASDAVCPRAFAGIQCGPGWEPLLRRLCRELERLILKIPADERAAYKAIRVCERFGGLFVYMNDATEEMMELIKVAESESYKICEFCGIPGRMRPGIWTKTFCDNCHQQFTRSGGIYQGPQVPAGRSSGSGLN